MRKHRATAGRRTFRTAVAGLLSLLLVAGGFAASPAFASEENGLKFTTTLLNETGTVTTPKQYNATLTYVSAKVAGKTIDIAFPSELKTLTKDDFNNVSDIEAMEFITVDGKNVMRITFKSKLEKDQGYLGFAYTVAAPDKSTAGEDIVWNVDGEEYKSTVTLLKPNDSISPVTSNRHSKTSNSNTIANSVSVGADRQVTVTSNDNAFAKYTIEIDAKDAREIDLSDLIDSRLEIIPSSIAAHVSTWDAAGLNRVDSALAGASVVGGMLVLDASLPANSRVVLTYNAKLTAAAAAALQTEFTAQLAAGDVNVGQTLAATFNNTVSIVGADDKSATVTLNKWVEQVQAPTGPNLDGVFGKSVVFGAGAPVGPAGSPTNIRPIVLAEDGSTLVTPVPVVYTFTAKMSQFVGREPQFQPTTNVIITDALDAARNIAWVDAAPTAGDGTTLTLASADLTDAEFARDAHVGSYRYVNGVLQINAGKSTAADLSFSVAANLVSIVPGNAYLNPGDNKFADKQWPLVNNAKFTFTDTTVKTTSKGATSTIYTAKDVSGGIKDGDVFSKTTPQAAVKVGADGIAQVPFTFNLGWKNVYDITKSTIVDKVDHSVFDVTEDNLAAIAETVTGSAGAGLKPGSITLALVDGNLEIALSESFIAANPWVVGMTQMNLTISLPTHKVDGKQTIDFTNKASLFGADRADASWTSEATSSATTYSGELEIRKVLYTGGGNWANNVRVEIVDGKLQTTEFIYRIELRPHGDLDVFPMVPVKDVLPAGMEFAGFVSDANLESGTVNTNRDGSVATTVSMAGNATAEIGEMNGGPALTLTGDLPKNSRPIVNFKVKIVDWRENISIVNSIGSSKATITPSNGSPLIIEKRDSVNASKLITDHDARFAVARDNGDGTFTTITDAAYLDNGNVVVDAADGGVSPVVVEDDGTYRISEMKAPAGYEKVILSADGTTSNKTATIVVADGESKAAVMYNAPKVIKTYAIGDVVWYDDANTGEQPSSDKRPVSGVVVTLLNSDGTPVSGVPTQTTGADGRYLFDNLDEGTYRVKFELPAEVAAKYTFTTQGTGSATDSDADPVTGVTGPIVLDDNNTSLTTTYDKTVSATQGIDPTWDAGIVRIPAPLNYAIGDRTWIDANKNGIQDPRESDIDGIIVTLLDGNGVPVDGVEPQVTVGGRYLFDELPAGDYQVRFEIPEDLRVKYSFTQSEVAGTDEGLTVLPNDDSDAIVPEGTTTPWIGTSPVITLGPDNDQLVSDDTIKATGGVDRTWDAGVIEKKVSVGDLVWIDQDRDGLQTPGEPGIPDVVLTIFGPDGTPVLDEFDQPRTATTSPSGEYLFDNLPALDEGQTYTVRIDPTTPENKKALGGLIPTRDDREGPTNSSTWDATSVPTLTTDGAHDPTLDFGFVTKTYAVGDYVWIDANSDGKQDVTEAVLPGVTVELLVNGEVVSSTTTNEQGKYIFDNLLAGEYEVRFTLTPEQQKIYAFTTHKAGAAGVGEDSNADPATGRTGTITLGDDNPNLTREYTDQAFQATQGIDPTWDAGVILLPVIPGEETCPDGTPSDPTSGCKPITGGENPDGKHPGGEDGGENPDPGTDGETPGVEEPGTGNEGEEGNPGTDKPVTGKPAPGEELSVTGQSLPVLPLLTALFALFAGLALVAVRRLARRS